jgi:predicted nucleic acid-binding protein
MMAIDASIAIKLVLQEADSVTARRVWQGWSEAGEILVAPALFRAETCSVVRRKVHQGILTDADGDTAYELLRDLPIQIHEPDNLYIVAWQLAKRFNRPTIYDSCYLALADIIGCELWTADQRLANAVGPQLSWVRLLGT